MTHNLTFAVAAAFVAALLFFPDVANGQAGTPPAGPVNNSVTSMDGRQAQTDIARRGREVECSSTQRGPRRGRF
jgi:hypothetical protein